MDLLAITRVTAGAMAVLPLSMIPPPTPELLREASARPEPADRPIAPMLLDGAGPGAIAAASRVDRHQLGTPVERLIGSLRVAVPGSGPDG